MRILVADDEAPIRDWFKYVVAGYDKSDWVVQTASSGDDAYNKIINYSPDIVFVDIKMPGMDGITMIERLKDRGQSCVFIILTNHAEFSYAQRAVSIGVYDYILKSDITADSIYSKLCDIQDALAGAQPNNHLHRFNFVELCKQPQLLCEKVHEQLTINPDNSCCVVLSTDKQQESYLSILLEATLDVIVGDYDDYVLMICFQPSRWESIFRAQDVDSNNSISVGVSGFFDGTSKLLEQINSSITALSYRFVDGSDAVYYYDELSCYSKMDSGEVYKNLSKLLNEISFSSLSSARKSTFEFLSQFEKIHPSQISLLKKICLKIYGTLEDRYVQEAIDIDDIAELIKQPVTFDGYHKSINEIFDRLENGQAQNSSSSIDTAIRYIQQNYDQPISLKTLSGLVFLSPEYFCRLFKNKVGVSFSTYLTTYRLDKAKHLLISTDLKISEIAGQVNIVIVCQYYYMI